MIEMTAGTLEERIIKLLQETLVCDISCWKL
jgi:hypothetical protein